MASVHNGKGDALKGGSYRGKKLLDQVMKVLEHITEKKVRERLILTTYNLFSDLKRALLMQC